MKHTPGPWNDRIGAYELKVGEAYRRVIQVSEGDCQLAIVNAPDTEGEANAHLIAAAPDLLEALKMIEPYLPIISDHGGSKKLLISAREAIAKAEGAQ